MAIKGEGRICDRCGKETFGQMCNGREKTKDCPKPKWCRPCMKETLKRGPEDLVYTRKERKRQAQAPLDTSTNELPQTWPAEPTALDEEAFTNHLLASEHIRAVVADPEIRQKLLLLTSERVDAINKATATTEGGKGLSLCYLLVPAPLSTSPISLISAGSYAGVTTVKNQRSRFSGHWTGIAGSRCKVEHNAHLYDHLQKCVKGGRSIYLVRPFCEKELTSEAAAMIEVLLICFLQRVGFSLNYERGCPSLMGEDAIKWMKDQPLELLQCMGAAVYLHYVAQQVGPKSFPFYKAAKCEAEPVDSLLAQIHIAISTCTSLEKLLLPQARGQHLWAGLTTPPSADLEMVKESWKKHQHFTLRRPAASTYAPPPPSSVACIRAGTAPVIKIAAPTPTIKAPSPIPPPPPPMEPAVSKSAAASTSSSTATASTLMPPPLPPSPKALTFKMEVNPWFVGKNSASKAEERNQIITVGVSSGSSSNEIPENKRPSKRPLFPVLNTTTTTINSSSSSSSSIGGNISKKTTRKKEPVIKIGKYDMFASTSFPLPPTFNDQRPVRKRSEGQGSKDIDTAALLELDENFFID